ncbi:MFS transporter [Mycetocola spongiae]|uniref:MFS transporter n=1 Tax=Mycetocola spongiae TaxID=2859226 RepID=UPI001CF51A3E|nr:MFS transporter [Mycetocola spongiae]UCR89926.1 MFS transporter [Mycetocola spongiae]
MNRLALVSPAFLSLFMLAIDIPVTQAIALMLFSSGLGQVIGGFFGGVLSDRYGPRRIIFASQALYIMTCAGILLSPPPSLLGILVGGAGLAAALPRAAAFTLATRLVQKEQRTRAYGYLYWGNNIGSTLSSVISGLLIQIWPHLLFLLSILGAIYYILIALRLPAAAAGAEERNPLSVRQFMRDTLHPFGATGMRMFLLWTFLISCVYMQKLGVLPLQMTALGIAPAVIGAVLAVNAVVVIACQPVLMRWSSRLGLGTTLMSGALLIAVGFGAYTFATDVYFFIPCVMIWTVGEMFLVPGSSAYIAAAAPGNRIGSYQSSYALAWSSGLSVGTPIGQLIWAAAGSTPIWIAALLLGGIAALGFRRLKPPT